MDFGSALKALKLGKRVSRRGWNGRGMWLCLIEGGDACHLGYRVQDCIAIKTADHLMQPGWLASQFDILAEDWDVVS